MQLDTVVINKKFRITLSEPITIDQPERLQKVIDSSMAVSPSSLQRLLGLFKFKDGAHEVMYGIHSPIWGVYQSVRKKPRSEEYLRDQIVVIIMINPETMARLYVRPSNHDRDAILAEMATARNVMGLLDLFGDLEEATIEYLPPWRSRANRSGPRAPRGPNPSSAPHSARPRFEGSSHRPFAQLGELAEFPIKPDRRRDKGDRRHDRYDD